MSFRTAYHSLKSGRKPSKPQGYLRDPTPASEYPVRLKRWLSCNECAMTQLHQPCEACPNRSAQGM